MKRLLLVLILFLIIFNLNAQSYKSNQLGQMLEETNEIETGYIIVVEGNFKTLYLDQNEVLKVETKVENENTYVITKDENQTITKIYNKGLLMKESIETQESTSSYNYSYINNKLALCTYIKDEEEPILTFFLRSSENSEPFATSRDTLSFQTDTNLFDNNHLFTILGNEAIVEGPVQKTENGYSLEVEDTLYSYSIDGLLIESENSTNKTNYFYEESLLTKDESLENNKKTINYYNNGKLIETQIFIDDNLISKITYENSLKKEELYDNDRLIAIVHYNADNKTVSSIEYL